MPTKLTRRDFLKLLAAASATAALSPALRAGARPPLLTPTPTPPPTSGGGTLYGRAIHTLTFYAEPDAASERLATRARDESFLILGETRAPFSAHNDLWYKTDLGYVHSAWVLPVRVYPPQPFIRDIGEWGLWLEISQIYTEAYNSPSAQSGRAYRFYGGTVFHAIEAHEDDNGTGWYKVYDDYPPRTYDRFQWVLASDARRIPKEEFAPITPFAGRKRIEIDLGQQLLTCYEGDTAVYTTQTASGLGEHATPRGEFAVLLKQPSRHMSNVPYPEMPTPTTAPGDVFDLPGVPWNTFFDLEGRAIHGAYWHNDFGIPRSHGCINVSIDAARFVYLWTHPIGGYADAFVQSNYRVGTPVIIF